MQTRLESEPLVSTPPSLDRIRPFRVVGWICAFLMVALGVLVFLGWLRNLTHLMSVRPGATNMKVNTSVLFVCAGLSLALAMRPLDPFRRWTRVTALACGMVIFVVGVLTTAEYAFHISLGIDQLLLRDPLAREFPGRMAPLTAVNFTLAGVALMLLNGDRLKRIAVNVLALLIGLSAYTGIVGYLYGDSIFYGSVSYTSMALHTGVGFLVLSIGLMVAERKSPAVRTFTERGSGGLLLRRVLPSAVLLPVALGWMYLHQPFAFLGLRFGLAIFAVALVFVGSAGLWMVAVSLNRTDAQRAETELVREQGAAALAQSEHDLRLVTDLLPILISYIDTEGRFQRVNATYERWTGQPVAAIVGRSIRDVLGEDYWERTAEARKAAFAGEATTFETQYPTLRGLRKVQITYAPDLDEDKRVRGFVSMVHDIDDHRRAEAALMQSEKLAVVGRLASSIAHEINNPLESVTNLLYLAEQDAARDSSLHAYVTLAQQELARVTHIVVQTLRFHRQSSYPVPCALGDILEQVLVLYHGRLHHARIVVERRFRQTHPLLCREGEVRQVLANLIGNAADAMAAAGQPGGRLLLRTRDTTDRVTGHAGVTVTIADTGHGIPAKTRQRLFEPFQSTKGPTGSGLGLWVSKDIVGRHGGTIRLRSAAGTAAHGTVFQVFFAHQHEAAPPALAL